MRTYDFEFKTPTSDNMVALMEKVIKKVTNKGFDVLDVYNPVVQHHWRELEKIALDLSEDDLDEYNDLTEPNEDAMVQRLGDLPQQIENGSSFLSQQSTRPVINNSSVDIAMEAKNKRVLKNTFFLLLSSSLSLFNLLIYRHNLKLNINLIFSWKSRPLQR